MIDMSKQYLAGIIKYQYLDIWMIFTMTYPFFIIIIHSLKEVTSTRIVDTMHPYNTLGVQFHKPTGKRTIFCRRTS